jgi:hypothetical protein
LAIKLRCSTGRPIGGPAGITVGFGNFVQDRDRHLIGPGREMVGQVHQTRQQQFCKRLVFGCRDALGVVPGLGQLLKEEMKDKRG